MNSGIQIGDQFIAPCHRTRKIVSTVIGFDGLTCIAQYEQEGRVIKAPLAIEIAKKSKI